MDDEQTLETATSARVFFTNAMSARLVELVTENYRRLYPTSDVADGNKLSNRTWELITQQLNSENPNNFKTVSQVQQKWNNIKRQTKSKVKLCQK